MRVSIESAGPKAMAAFKAEFEGAGYEVSISPPVESVATDFWRVARIGVEDIHELPRISLLTYHLLEAGKATGVEAVILLGSNGEELRRVAIKGHHWREDDSR